MPENNNTSQVPFKKRKTLSARIDEVQGIRRRYPKKIPVIVERFYKEYHMPQLDKTKFLVPEEMNMSQFVIIIRNRMKLDASHILVLYIDEKYLASMSMSMAELYDKKKSEDGFLYMSYASKEYTG